MSNSIGVAKEPNKVKTFLQMFWNIKIEEKENDIDKVIIEMPQEDQEEIKKMLKNIQTMENGMKIPEQWKKTNTKPKMKEPKVIKATINLKEELSTQTDKKQQLEEDHERNF